MYVPLLLFSPHLAIYLRQETNVIDMARCRYCAQPIVWQSIGGNWRPKNQNGTVHQCRMSRVPQMEISPKDAFCAKCFKPIYRKTGDKCNCTEPVWIHKTEVRSAKKIQLMQKKTTARAELLGTSRTYDCLLCGSTALRTGDSVICLTDFAHTFSADLFG